jgi:hypothetical protein
MARDSFLLSRGVTSRHLKGKEPSFHQALAGNLPRDSLNIRDTLPIVPNREKI